jgi:SAM-dependent methyltransferase
MIGDNSYGDDYVDVYDQYFDTRDSEHDVGAMLAGLAAGGRALEFGIGTGRLAIPLSAAGIEVHGIDNSAGMLDVLKTKPRAAGIRSYLGDATTLRIPGEFQLVFIGFSTIYLLGSQQVQLQCFRNAAAHLPVGGKFLVEAFLHDRSHWATGEQFSTTGVERETVTVRAAIHDPVEQVIRLNHMTIKPDGVSFRPNRLRYIWPSELDLMGQLAGMRLVGRWADWKKSPFNAQSTNMVSVYEKLPADP